MMEVTMIPPPVATALTVQTMQCAGTAAAVLIRYSDVSVEVNALMALMSLTHIHIVIIAQKRALCPAQVFLETVANSVMVFQPVRISGTNYSQLVNLTWTVPNPTRLSVVKKMGCTSVKMDPSALLMA